MARHQFECSASFAGLLNHKEASPDECAGAAWIIMQMAKVLTIAFVTWMPMTACLAQPAAKSACNAEVDVTDTDPKGTNVRAAPSGTVILALKTPSSDGYIVVHLTGQLGDWYEIDRAKLIDSSLPSGEKILFQGTGYLHKSVVGVGGME